MRTYLAFILITSVFCGFLFAEQTQEFTKEFMLQRTVKVYQAREKSILKKQDELFVLRRNLKGGESAADLLNSLKSDLDDYNKLKYFMAEIWLFEKKMVIPLDDDLKDDAVYREFREQLKVGNYLYSVLKNDELKEDELARWEAYKKHITNRMQEMKNEDKISSPIEITDVKDGGGKGINRTQVKSTILKRALSVRNGKETSVLDHKKRWGEYTSEQKRTLVHPVK